MRARTASAILCSNVLIEVFHQDNPSAKVPTYAVLDDQSTDVFITETLLEKLKVEGQEVNLEINTITDANSVLAKKVNGLRIQDTKNRHKSIKIPFAYSQENISARQGDIATPEIARSWKHLEEIACHIHYRPDVEMAVTLLQHSSHCALFMAGIINLVLKNTSSAGRSLVLFASTKKKKH